MTPIVYLHGFASSPMSGKAQFFKSRFAARGIHIDVPQLDRGDFTGLTITGQLEVIADTVKGRPAVLMGSSLGGYLASLFAARHENICKLVLLAPAIQFPRRWRARYSPEDLERWKRWGSVPIFHYGSKEQVRLGYQFMEDSMKYEDEPDFKQPALILHGLHDDVVPARISELYANQRGNITLKLVESAHELTDVLDKLWAETEAFLFPDGGSGRLC
jgi:pimeloyl-ACP methyl ester carboxylesterase